MKRFCGRGSYQTDSPPLYATVSGIITQADPPTESEWDEFLGQKAAQSMEQYGHKDLAGLHRSGRLQVTELKCLPAPPLGDARPLLPWRISAIVSCEEQRFEDPISMIFHWPEQPPQEVQRAISDVLASDGIALRGYDQSYAEVTEVLNLKVETLV